MLEIKDLNVTIGTREIIKNLSFILNKNDKLAIIGEEGNGKSTLLKAILGICPYADITGSIQSKYLFGYLEQSISDKNLSLSVFQYLFQNQEEYYEKINLLYSSLRELKLDSNIIDRKLVRTLSGGEKVKLQLLKLLLDEADILLLDEPTNDLDIETLEWLEDFIRNIDKPVIYVSHDETLLECTANRILHLELVKKKRELRAIIYQGTYGNYVSERIHSFDKMSQIASKEEHNQQKQREKLQQIKSKVEHQLNTISRADPHGAQLLKKKMKTVKAQERRMEDMNLTEFPEVEEAIHFFFQTDPINHNKVIYQLPLQNRSDFFSIKGSTHLVMIGKNGIGKTTLLHHIYDELKERKDLKIGFMPQNYDQFLTEETATDFLTIIGDKEENSFIRSCMGNMNFTKEEMMTPVKDLSGGSKAKLFLLKLMLEKSNVLLLDEPTRNVSPLSNPIIRKSLQDYPGAIISISHDRIYMEEVASNIIEVKKDGLYLK